MKILTQLISQLALISACSICYASEPAPAKIGIIVPLEHVAMNEIVAGFSDTLHSLYPHPVKIEVKNAQNDLNIERAIIQQMRDTHETIIAPIGTDATRMSLATIHQQPIVSLAADFSQQDRTQLKSCNIAVVHDEIPGETSIAFIHAVYPEITQITLIHSSADKVFPEVKKIVAAGKKNNITVTPLMAATLPDLTSVAQSTPSTTQAIFILKDHLIVSGIGTLAKIAHNRHIPLITSDQGSVEGGAGFAIGVPERQIGVEGAKLVVAILEGKNPCDLPLVEMKKLTVFINQSALKQETQNLSAILSAAKKSGYQVDITDAHAEK